MITEIVPNIRPEPKQHQAYLKLWDKITRFITFGGGAGGGKSWLGAEWLLQNCYRYPGTKWFIGRNELTRLMGSSFTTFQKVCVYHNIPIDDWSLNGQYHYIKFKNGSRIDLIDLKFQPSDPMYQRFGSLEYTGGWIEEGGEIHFMAFDILKTRVGRWMNTDYDLYPAKILITCNPEQNWIYRIFYKPFKAGTLPADYAFIKALYDDNSYTKEQYEQQLNLITDNTMRARLRDGLWEYMAGDNSLTTYDAVTDLFTNVLPESTEYYASADVARFGSDQTVIGAWKGFNLVEIVNKSHRGIDQTSNDLKELMSRRSIPYSQTIVDEDGVGGGVVDITTGVKGFVGNSTALKTKEEVKNGKPKQNYANLRSQCGFMLANEINNHRIAISAPIDETVKEMIIEDLLHLLKRKETNTEAPLSLIPKEEIKENLGRSPDYGDMMSMRMYFELDRPIKYIPDTEFGGVLPFMGGTLA